MNYEMYKNCNWKKWPKVRINWQELLSFDNSLTESTNLVLDVLVNLVHSDDIENEKQRFKSKYDPEMIKNETYLFWATRLAAFFHDHQWMEHIAWENIDSSECAQACLTLPSIHANLCYRLRKEKYVDTSLRSSSSILFETTPDIWLKLHHLNETKFHRNLDFHLSSWCWEQFMRITKDMLQSDIYRECFKKGLSTFPYAKKSLFAFYLCVVEHPEYANLTHELNATSIDKKQFVLNKLWNDSAHLPRREDKEFNNQIHRWLTTFLGTPNVLTALNLLCEPGEALEFTIKQLKRSANAKDKNLYKASKGYNHKSTAQTKNIEIIQHIVDTHSKEGQQKAYSLFLEHDKAVETLALEINDAHI